MKSRLEKDKKRRELVEKFERKRQTYKFLTNNQEIAEDVRFKAMLQFSKLPRNSSKIRIRNRCVITGRPRAVYKHFKLSRIIFRDYASEGKIPGLKKYSW